MKNLFSIHPYAGITQIRLRVDTKQYPLSQVPLAPRYISENNITIPSTLVNETNLQFCLIHTISTFYQQNQQKLSTIHTTISLKIRT